MIVTTTINSKTEATILRFLQSFQIFSPLILIKVAGMMLIKYSNVKRNREAIRREKFIHSNIVSV
jgi:hypothetical protein